MRFVIVLAYLLFFLSVAQAEYRVLAGTSHLKDIVKDLSNDTILVKSLIEGGACPGHYDIKPSAAAFIEKADLIIIQAFQKDFAYVKKLRNFVSGARIIVLKTKGNYFVPDIQIAAAKEVADILSTIKAKDAKLYNKRLNGRILRVRAIGDEVLDQQDLSPLKGKAVLASKRQAAFLEFLGMSVHNTFSNQKDLSAQELSVLIQDAKDNGVSLIVDNLQSKQKLGAFLSRNLKLAHVVLSSFPEGYKNTDTWEKSFMKNLQILKQANG